MRTCGWIQLLLIEIKMSPPHALATLSKVYALVCGLHNFMCCPFFQIVFIIKSIFPLWQFLSNLQAELETLDRMVRCFRGEKCNFILRLILWNLKLVINTTSSFAASQPSHTGSCRSDLSVISSFPGRIWLCSAAAELRFPPGMSLAPFHVFSVPELSHQWFCLS